MSQPVRKPANQKLAKVKRVNTLKPKGHHGGGTTKNPGSKPAKRIAGRLTDSRRFAP